ncbi:hypothetical protein GQ602_000861 [Ophiocordyceps camponoti-floridani]|uniref:holo-[acyl-carrier-protein] synthase n=1 Tax=Ophiocordyceps camponoti-floridani TaxID=2030778 RepID=A0A8H4QCY9_9HYPO|nr:hypothetical protein GQ602_000861 [Ophiocordyceps camponoti-floridani]
MDSVSQWLLDTRPLWPSALETKHLVTAASRALSLLSEEEQSQVLRFYFVRDAKLALASALVKRLVISRLADMPWSASRPQRHAETGKPVFTAAPHLRFNVSHQAGLVVVIATVCHDADVDVGIDVVCPSERRDRDRSSIAAEGWSRYVAVHQDVFGPEEAAALRARNDHVDRRLEYFYALWCLREAYIKMTGEALLAPWLRELEMRHFAPPDGEPALEVWFRGRRVDDVCMRLSPLLDDYMVCTAVRCPAKLKSRFEEHLAEPFTQLVLDDILAEAEAGSAPR